MEYTELELLSHANAMLDEVTQKIDLTVSGELRDMAMFILAAQHKLDLLKEILE